MTELIQTYLPNVYKMGWSGQAGWGTAIYLTLYMTVLSFIIGGFLGLVAGLFLVLTAPGGVLENKVVFWILDKITSIFRAVPFIILLAILSPLSHLIVKTSIGPNAALVPLSFAVFAFFARQVQVVLAELDGGGHCLWVQPLHSRCDHLSDHHYHLDYFYNPVLGRFLDQEIKS